ncbi:MAG TPA: T9SS type A sorting domain-containing protein, partial [Lutibacter sp.]|nr:T9SS type A sorting domain-containing protein [Lutibacter sp.]
HYLKLNGNIDLVGESQLVQKRYGVYDTNFPYNFSTIQFGESIFDAASTGKIERDQQGKKNSFNYNYWSSPVTRQGAANNAPYKLPDVLRDGTNSAIPRNINFVDGAYSADGPVESPIKITSRWIWTYRATIGADPWANYYQWVNVGYWGSINVGDGYTMKGTGGAAPISETQNYVFVGKPNSGDITTTQLNPNQIYLIGNPYPSALDANEFIKNNLNVFDGALRFWDHFGLSNNHLLAQYEGGYATYNLSGGVPGASNVLLTAFTGEVSSKIPERYIPVGQGFFVDADDTTTPGNLNFKNGQRVFKREVVTGTNSGSLFMKTATSKKSNTQEMQETTADNRPKIRLTFISSLGFHRPLLVTMDKNTSNQFDFGYDAPLNENNKEDMYWQLGQRKLVIQGVNNFNENQELPLGLKIAKTGLASIKIQEVQYIDENTTLHIKDKFTGKTHNISHKPFEIELEPGTYLDRFALIFRYQKLVAEDLGTDILLVEPVLEDHNYHVFMNNTIAELQIKNNGTDEIRSITLFNILGQTMMTWNKELNRRIISLPVKLATGVYMVQINTINGTFNKRIIIE